MFGYLFVKMILEISGVLFFVAEENTANLTKINAFY